MRSLSFYLQNVRYIMKRKRQTAFQVGLAVARLLSFKKSDLFIKNLFFIQEEWRTSCPLKRGHGVRLGSQNGFGSTHVYICYLFPYDTLNGTDLDPKSFHTDIGKLVMIITC